MYSPDAILHKGEDYLSCRRDEHGTCLRLYVWNKLSIPLEWVVCHTSLFEASSQTSMILFCDKFESMVLHRCAHSWCVLKVEGLLLFGMGARKGEAWVAAHLQRRLSTRLAFYRIKAIFSCIISPSSIDSATSSTQGPITKSCSGSSYTTAIRPM